LNSQDKHKTLELLRCLRKKRLKRIHQRFRDAEYLERIGRDNDDVKVEKEMAALENGILIARTDLETAKFLQDKVRLISDSRAFDY
jgi:hypothetical protein